MDNTSSAERVPPELVERIQQRLATEGGLPTSAGLAAAVRAEAGVLVSDAQMLKLIRALRRELVGAGPLAEFLADPRTTDVVVNAPDDVRIDRGSGWERLPVSFTDDAAVQRLARRLAASAERRLDDAHPYVDAQLPDGTRLHAVLSPTAASGTCLSLRVLRPARYDLETLLGSGTFPIAIHRLLTALLRARLAYLITGGTGTGKTTLLAAMLGAADPADRIVTVEDVAELHPAHPHVVSLVARADNVEGIGRIGLRDLVRQALRMRPDRLVVGEVRGAEVIDLLIALNTGHQGGAGTLHANTVADVPARLAALGSLGGMDSAALHAQLIGAVQVIVHLARETSAGGNTRVITEIGVLTADPNGRVSAERACDRHGTPAAGATDLERMLAERGVIHRWR